MPGGSGGFWMGDSGGGRGVRCLGVGVVGAGGLRLEKAEFGGWKELEGFAVSFSPLLHPCSSPCILSSIQLGVRTVLESQGQISTGPGLEEGGVS